MAAVPAEKPGVRWYLHGLILFQCAGRVVYRHSSDLLSGKPVFGLGWGLSGMRKFDLAQVVLLDRTENIKPRDYPNLGKADA